MDQARAMGPEAIMQMMQGAVASAVLKAGVEVNAFGALEAGPLDAKGAASRIGAPERTTRILFDALAVLGLVVKADGKYALTPAARDHLVPGKPMYLGDVTNIFNGPMLWPALPQLAQAVKSGGTVMESHAETPAHPFWETFAQSSAAMAFPAAMALDAYVGAFLAGKPRARVLDVACGSGIVGLTLAKHPNVEVTLLDWPNVLDKTKTWAQRLEADASRVKYLPGNFFEIDWKGPYDLVVLSHVYHHFDDATCRTITRKAAAALEADGRIAINDMVHDASLANPGATMFSVIMMLWTRKGEAFTLADYSRWLKDGGFAEPSVHPAPGMPASWMIAQRA